jgi:cell division protease FtsH
LTPPSGDEDKPRRSRWLRLLIWFGLPYLVIFGLLSLQDQFTGAQTVSYTEFINQVEAKNVSQVFSRGDTTGQSEAGSPVAWPGGPHLPDVRDRAAHLRSR